MNFNEYQKLAEKTAIYPLKGNNPYYPTMGLCGEAGEIANQVKKIMRDDHELITQERSEKLVDEIGGVLWYAAMLAYELDIPLQDIAEQNIYKLQKRQEKGTIQGSGDNR